MRHVAIDPVIIKPRFPVLSKAGRRLLVLSVPWFFATLIAFDALGLIGRDAPKELRWLAIVPVAPYVLLVFHPWLGRLPGLRWLRHPVQPRIEISSIGLDLQLPDVGRHV
jgi:hypothetical protein